MKRTQLKNKPKQGFYFAAESEVEFIPSGCTLLDCVLGGGWPIGSISNIVGDRSTGKTLIAIEACANFRNKFKGPICYDVGGGETFDKNYAEHLGLPKTDVRLEESGTVEDWYNTLSRFLSDNEKVPSLYVLDSLDALSDQAELDRKIHEGTYGTKAKKIGEALRRLDKRLTKQKCALLIVSQIRDNIGVMFGKKYKRSGGKALDFWAAQCLWLAEVKKLQKTKRGIKRAIGIEVRAKSEKNKVGLPFRDCTFPLLFNYGMDDVGACENFLKIIKIPIPEKNLEKTAISEWMKLEEEFSEYLPGKKKYG